MVSESAYHVILSDGRRSVGRRPLWDAIFTSRAIRPEPLESSTLADRAISAAPSHLRIATDRDTISNCAVPGVTR